MKKDIVDIVMEKEFIELTDGERKELQEFCSSEDEFNQLKLVFAKVEGMSFESISPKEETKERLDELFDQTYPKTTSLWYSSVLTVLVPKDKPVHRKPLVQIAALVLLLILVIPVFRNTVVKEDTLLAEHTVTEKEEMSSSESDLSTVELADDDLETVSVVDEELSEVPMEENATLQVEEEFLDEITVLRDDNLAQPLAEAYSWSEANVASAPVSTHPDGVFIGLSGNAQAAYSQSASESSDLLDLLTATF